MHAIEYSKLHRTRDGPVLENVQELLVGSVYPHVTRQIGFAANRLVANGASHWGLQEGN